ncbi:pentatricopeptide repeat-containing protein At1g31790 [Ananas comosus]|uniref:Pentatricopeptide repeat-containing protein At1g31790 n=2 Tax=Ananas comosus TaxID=4615 RepID=A0A6P5G8Y2_ANACO|nr:pentatricopeptide repeat-containing protein At1g31790 [Ananas comosus]CAD1816795.1 unnamed protein product [Ananas comosus var. bracteatus]
MMAASSTAAAMARTHTTAAGRWWRRTPSSEPSAQARAVLPLQQLRRPQLPSTTTTTTTTTKQHPLGSLITTEGDEGEEEEEEQEQERRAPWSRACRVKTATAGDVLCLMDALRLPVEEDVYVDLIKECTHSRDAVQGAEVHAHILVRTRGAAPAGLILANRLLLMYAACGKVEAARQLFDRMPARDAVSWAAVIAAYSHDNSSSSTSHCEATKLFTKMRAAEFATVAESRSRCCLDAILMALLRSCGRARELGLGRQVHGLIEKMMGASGAGSSLIQFYSTLGRRDAARQALDRVIMYPFQEEDWTSMIACCCREGLFEEAISIFRKTARLGKRGNPCSLLTNVLKACARIGDGGWIGRQVHTIAIKLGAESDQYVGSSLFRMYSQNGLLADARRSLDSVSRLQDDACWNAVLTAYARRGCFEEAIRLLYEKKAAGLQPPQSMVKQIFEMVYGC